MTKIIHIHRQVIDRNTKKGTQDPPIIIRKGTKRLGYAHTIRIEGPCEFVYSPDKPLDCGARLWLETNAPIVAKNMSGEEKRYL